MQPYLIDTPTLRTATTKDLAYIDALQKKFAKAVAFRPRVALETYIEAGRIQLATENGQPAGYMLANPELRYQPGLTPIFQACVQMDAQRRHHGFALLTRLQHDAHNRGMRALQANCREGLEANEFWAAAGFEPIARIFHFATKDKWLICWRKLIHPVRPRWFYQPPSFAGGTNARTRPFPRMDI